MIRGSFIHTQLGAIFPNVVYAYVPTESDCSVCGFDEFTGGGKDISCTTCEGTGKVTEWTRSAFRARVNWIDAARPMYGVVTSGDIGDVWLTIALRDKPAVQIIQRTRRAYFIVDGRHVRPFSINSNSVLSPTSLDVRCNLFAEET